MTDVVEIPLGEWLPDRPSLKNPGCEVADNVLPAPGGYEPLLSPVVAQGEVSDRVRGALQTFEPDGESVILGGTDTSLFIRRENAITETTGLASIGNREAWDFARFNSFAIATAANNPPQYLDNVDIDDTWTDLPGDPPQAKRCAKAGEFLILGGIAGNPSRIQWSAINDPGGDWTPARITQAGFADLDPALGEVQRIVGGRYGMVFQSRGVSRLSYVGSPQVWRVDPVSTERGAVAPFAVVPFGYTTYFLAQDGFYVTNGSAVEPVGAQRINRWFFDTVEQSRLSQVQGAVDWQNQCIVWAFQSTDSAEFDRALIYSWQENRWSTGTFQAGWLVSTNVDGMTLEQVAEIYPDLDAMGPSLDDAIFKAKDRRLAVFRQFEGDTRYHRFEGDPLPATWETGDFQPAPGRRVFVNEARPEMIAATWDAEISLLARDEFSRRADGPAVPVAWGGWAPVMGEGQTMALRLRKPPGHWTGASGLQIRFRPAGYR